MKYVDKNLICSILGSDLPISQLEITYCLTFNFLASSSCEMSALFERDRSGIGKHIRKIYQEGELDENRTRAKNARHLEDGRIFQVDVYNLDVIIAVGYRVNLKE